MRSNVDDLTCTETESIISSRPGHHSMHKSARHEKYNQYNGKIYTSFSDQIPKGPLTLIIPPFLGLRMNGHSRLRGGHGYESSSMLSSDLETTSFLESEDDASSRITSTTGRHTQMSMDRGTLGEYCIYLM